MGTDALFHLFQNMSRLHIQNIIIIIVSLFYIFQKLLPFYMHRSVIRTLISEDDFPLTIHKPTRIIKDWRKTNTLKASFFKFDRSKETQNIRGPPQKCAHNVYVRAQKPWELSWWILSTHWWRRDGKLESCTWECIHHRKM